MRLSVMFHDAHPEDRVAAEGYRLVKIVAGKYGHKETKKDEDATVYDQPGESGRSPFFSYSN